MTERKVNEQKGPNFSESLRDAMKKLGKEKQEESIKTGGKKSG